MPETRRKRDDVPVDTTDCFAEWLPTEDYVGASEAGNTEPSLDFRLTARDLERRRTSGGVGPLRWRTRG